MAMDENMIMISLKFVARKKWTDLRTLLWMVRPSRTATISFSRLSSSRYHVGHLACHVRAAPAHGDADVGRFSKRDRR